MTIIIVTVEKVSNRDQNVMVTKSLFMKISIGYSDKMKLNKIDIPYSIFQFVLQFHFKL